MKRVMIIRPKQYISTTYTNKWLAEIVVLADKFGWDVVDLTDRAANREMVEEWIKKFNPQLIIGAGHGFPNRFLGDDNRPIFDESNIHLLRGRIVYLFSCSVGRNLGKKIAEQGANFIGWTVPIRWDLTPPFDPFSDPKALPIREVNFRICEALLKGKNVEEAYLIGLATFDKWIEKLREKKDYTNLGFMIKARQGFVAYSPRAILTIEMPQWYLPSLIFLLAGFALIYLSEEKEPKLSEFLGPALSLIGLSLSFLR